MSSFMFKKMLLKATIKPFDEHFFGYGNFFPTIEIQ